MSNHALWKEGELALRTIPSEESGERARLPATSTHRSPGLYATTSPLGVKTIMSVPLCRIE